MGILDKFQDEEAKKSLSDDLKSKVGISESEFAEEKKIAENIEDQQDSINTKKEKGVEKAKANESTKLTNDKPIKRKEVIDKHENLELRESSDLEVFVTNFTNQYKHSEKENRILRLEKKNYKSVIKLKVDKIAMSEFINFAIHFTLKSSSYNEIVKLLKKPK